MDENFSFVEGFVDLVAPQVLAGIMGNEADREMSLKLGELCRKHKISFVSFVKLICDLSQWEKERFEE